MRPVEPILSSQATRDGIAITASFESPESRRLALSLVSLARGIVIVALTISAVNILVDWPERFIAGQRMVAMFAAVVLVVAAARGLSALVADRRFGLRQLTDRRLSIELTRDAVITASGHYRRGPKLAFTSEPHRRARAEERAERVSGETIAEVYRLAHEVRLQHGEEFVVLAEVSDDIGANAIVRRLQAADDEVTRGQGSHSKAPFEDRPRPE